MATAKITTTQLLEAGVHFGHQTRRWNPKMSRFILTKRNGIHIIDLTQTADSLNVAFDFVKQTVAHGGNILFVGTKRQAQETIAAQATRVGQPFVNHRWLGGMLTNFSTISKRLTRLRDLEGIDFTGQTRTTLTKKELLLLNREKDKLSDVLGGIRDMKHIPSALWVVDVNKEHLAIDEAKKLGIPVIAFADTNVDPDTIDFPIPGNDDSISSIELITRIIADAVAQGLVARSTVSAKAAPTADSAAIGENPVAAKEDLADWEKELLGVASADALTASVVDSEDAQDEKAQAKNKAKKPATKAATK